MPPHPLDLASCLVLAPRAPLAIVHIPFDALRRHLGALGLRVGDRARVAPTSDGHVVLHKADGSAVLVDRRHAALIEVRLLDDAAARPAAWPSAVAVGVAQGGEVGRA